MTVLLNKYNVYFLIWSCLQDFIIDHVKRDCWIIQRIDYSLLISFFPNISLIASYHLSSILIRQLRTCYQLFKCVFLIIRTIYLIIWVPKEDSMIIQWNICQLEVWSDTVQLMGRFKPYMWVTFGRDSSRMLSKSVFRKYLLWGYVSYKESDIWGIYLFCWYSILHNFDNSWRMTNHKPWNVHTVWVIRNQSCGSNWETEWPVFNLIKFVYHFIIIIILKS